MCVSELQNPIAPGIVFTSRSNFMVMH